MYINVCLYKQHIYSICINVSCLLYLYILSYIICVVRICTPIISRSISNIYIYIHTHVYRVQTGVYPGASCCFNNGFWLIDLAYQHVVDRCFFLFRWEMSKSSLRCFFGKHSEEIAASDFPLESEFWSRHFFRRISLSLSLSLLFIPLYTYVYVAM